MPTSLSLPGELTIYTISELRPAWLAWLDVETDNDCIGVDASAVCEVDGAGVQLLVSLSNALAARRRTLRLDNPSETLARACDALGVTSLCAAPASEGAAS